MRLIRFACVGGMGFVVDGGILTVLVNGFDWGVFKARAISFCAAVSCTWYVNRRWVFVSMRRRRDEYSNYFLVQMIGAGLNLCIYVALIKILPVLATAPIVPLAAGAALALLFNYFAAARLVFGRPAA